MVVLESGEPPGSDGRSLVETVRDDSAARERILFRIEGRRQELVRSNGTGRRGLAVYALFVFILVLVLVQIVFVGFSRCRRSRVDGRLPEEFLPGIGR